ncbi:MAG: DUF3795 domain-containing protein [Oscillospiraceae bacterium]|nr:DUF3795 domain-containing protein [Oscillospiraceae bacterium]
MGKYEALSYCGMFCGECANYKQNMNCQGCRNETALVDDCPTRACAIQRGLLHCGECGEFPCVMLNDFYYDGKPSHLAAFHNMQKIIKNGADEWLMEQNK